MRPKGIVQVRGQDSSTEKRIGQEKAETNNDQQPFSYQYDWNFGLGPVEIVEMAVKMSYDYSVPCRFALTKFA